VQRPKERVAAVLLHRPHRQRRALRLAQLKPRQERRDVRQLRVHVIPPPGQRLRLRQERRRVRLRLLNAPARGVARGGQLPHARAKRRQALLQRRQTVQELVQHAQ
jgi:hypothetical protein